MKNRGRMGRIIAACGDWMRTMIVFFKVISNIHYGSGFQTFSSRDLYFFLGIARGPKCKNMKLHGLFMLKPCSVKEYFEKALADHRHILRGPLSIGPRTTV